MSGGVGDRPRAPAPGPAAPGGVLPAPDLGGGAPSPGPGLARPSGRLAALGSEGFRLFFPLAALHAALWPALWVIAWGYGLPLARAVPPSLWHAHEMLVGAFGAALLGFLLTAAPEWTDTAPPRGRPLWALAGLWLAGRAVGLLGWDGLGLLGAVADLLWLSALLVWLLALSRRRRTGRLLAFAGWLAALLLAVGAARLGFARGDLALAETALRLAGLAFLGLLGLALARVTPPVTNLVLDPTEETTPFRPHPGRLHLAPGLVAVAMAGEALGLSPAVSGFLLVAAGAAFLDRVGEGFVGREALRAEIAILAGASALAGAGLGLAGAARLGAPWGELAGWHLAFMGGLGLGVLGVFAIAGRLHTGRPLGLAWPARAAALGLVAAALWRVAPDLGLSLPLGQRAHAVASLLWAASFLLWLAAEAPAFAGRGDRGREDEGPGAGRREGQGAAP